MSEFGIDEEAAQPAPAAHAPADTAYIAERPPVPPPAADCPGCGRADCPTCGQRQQLGALGAGRHVYAMGRVEPRFPNLSVEKEFAQATARAETVGLGDRELVRELLTTAENTYLARLLCWTLTIEGIESYLLVPRDIADVALLVAALRPAPRATDIDVVIGTLGMPAPEGYCAGLRLPTVSLAQIYSFDPDEFVTGLETPKGVDEKAFRTSAEDVLERVLQLADNAGAADEHRALNYLAVRYAAVYESVARRNSNNQSLASVEARSSRLAGARTVVDVVFSFRDRGSDVVEKEFARVDVTDMFPFLVTKLSPYYDR